jgi:hypothetical protein
MELKDVVGLFINSLHLFIHFAIVELLCLFLVFFNSVLNGYHYFHQRMQLWIEVLIMSW